MFDQIDRAYYERRFRDELQKAAETSDAGVKRVRLSLAAEYAQKAQSLIDEPA